MLDLGTNAYSQTLANLSGSGIVSNGTLALGRSLRRVQTGRIQTYLYGALGGALVVVLINFLIS